MSISGDVGSGPDAFRIDGQVLRALRDGLPAVAAQTLLAVMAEVPGYRVGFRGPMGESIQAAVQMAIGGFLKLASGTREGDPSTPRRTTLDGAYALGRGEARAGRSMDALLAAYRVGARVSWRGLARNAAEAGLPASAMAEFAELLFAYIDELSAASVAGYNDELNTSGRVRERYRERLGQRLLAGGTADVLTAAAERAEWTPPTTLTAVLLPAAQVHGVLALLGAETLLVSEELPGADSWAVDQPHALLLVPEVDGGGRQHLIRVLDRRQAVVGPARPWLAVRASYDRAVRTLALVAAAEPELVHPVDSEDHLVDLVVGADGEALADLRARVLEPLAELAEATRERLAETLLCWLLHQGRREEVAEALHVHAQTVRYRMQQVRELYGDRLLDERFVRELVVALVPQR
ncbi:PucR family transcriptional regulator [Microlunatus aurantiacus]|uniref:PucR family transcriptional regulator n=1 Tax=Microlunatus aurantiacus TaxID=446786 RepID=A0ABP7DJ25_9ACTN